MCGRPLSLASALTKLERGVTAHPMNAQPATAHMFIVNPLRGRSFSSFFSTHPSTAERVAKLQELAQKLGSGEPAYTWR